MQKRNLDEDEIGKDNIESKKAKITQNFQTSRSLDAIRKHYTSQIVPNAEKYNLYD